MTVLLDSWAWIEYFISSPVGIKLGKKYIETNEEVLVTPINISEIYYFFLKEKPKHVDAMIDFILRKSFLTELSADIAKKAAKLKHEQRFALADAIVLASAREFFAEVVTGDSDFKGEKDVIYLGK